MDQSLTHWTNSPAGHNAMLDAVMLAFTQFGAIILIILVAIQWWSRADRHHVRHVTAAAGLSFLLGLGFNQLILLVVHRARPYDAGVSHLIISRSADWSFPSDHATATIAIAATFLAHNLLRRGSAFLAMATVICISRIYVGTHYVTDILGGVLTGALAAILVRAIYREGTRFDRLITSIL